MLSSITTVVSDFYTSSNGNGNGNGNEDANTEKFADGMN